MFILGNFLGALAFIVDKVIFVLYWLIIIRALISWVNPDPYNALVQFLYKTTEPMLEPFRRLIPTHNIGIDLSPIFAILVLIFLQRFLVPTIVQVSLIFQ